MSDLSRDLPTAQHKGAEVVHLIPQLVWQDLSSVADHHSKMYMAQALG